MILTEDEAKTKWCPFARVAYGIVETVPVAIVGNRPRDGMCACIASDCMAWRASMHFVDGRTGTPAEPGKTYPVGTLDKAKSEFGYCGLAGDNQS